MNVEEVLPSLRKGGSQAGGSEKHFRLQDMVKQLLCACDRTFQAQKLLSFHLVQ